MHQIKMFTTLSAWSAVVSCGQSYLRLKLADNLHLNVKLRHAALIGHVYAIKMPIRHNQFTLITKCRRNTHSTVARTYCVFIANHV